MKIAIVGGAIIPEKLIKDIQDSVFVIGVDRGAHWLITKGIVPDLAIGDFDSVNDGEFEMIKKSVKVVKKFPPEKDFSDLELAVDEATKLNPRSIAIYGATGGRLDHFFTAAFLLKKILAAKIPAKLIDEDHEILLVDKKSSFEKSKKIKYFSIFPFSPICRVSLKGFKYNLSEKTLRFGDTIGLSNEIKSGKAEIDVANGTLLIVRSSGRPA